MRAMRQLRPRQNDPRPEDRDTEPFLDTIPIPPYDPADDVAFRARRPSRRLAIAGAILAVVAFGAASVFVVQNRAAARTAHGAAEAPPVQTLDDDGWRFTVHLPTGTEALYDLQLDPRCRQNVIRVHGDRAARMRADLLRRCGVETMDQLRAPHQQLTEALKRLGYL